MAHRVVLVPGDGVGPEVVEAARQAVEATGAAIEWDVQLAGQAARDQLGSPLPPETIMAIRDAGAALKGATTSGGPGPGPASANVELRRALDLHLGVRPARSMDGAGGARPGIDLVLASMIQEDLYAGVSLAAGSDQARVLRELVMAGSELEAAGEAGFSIKFMTRLGAERIVRTGLAWAGAAEPSARDRGPQGRASCPPRMACSSKLPEQWRATSAASRSMTFRSTWRSTSSTAGLACSMCCWCPRDTPGSSPA